MYVPIKTYNYVWKYVYYQYCNVIVLNETSFIILMLFNLICIEITLN